MTELKKIKDKYKQDNWLLGQFIPIDEKKIYKLIFIGEKPSDYFLKHPDKKYLGNYNATSVDKKLQIFLKKYELGQIYITDLVKNQGKSGADFMKEWRENNIFKKCLSDELSIINPDLVVLMSKKAECIFNQSFPNIFKTILIYHPSYVFRYAKYKQWQKQFEEIKRDINDALNKII